MSITNLQTLKINYLTQAQYDNAKVLGELNEDEFYLTPIDLNIMKFKGCIGENGDITWSNLALASTANIGDVYKVITNHSAENGKPAAKIGNMIISNGTQWIVIPSKDFQTNYQSNGNNRAVQQDNNGNLYVEQIDTNTTYIAGDGINIDSNGVISINLSSAEEEEF